MARTTKAQEATEDSHLIAQESAQIDEGMADIPDIEPGIHRQPDIEHEEEPVGDEPPDKGEEDKPKEKPKGAEPKPTGATGEPAPKPPKPPEAEVRPDDEEKQLDEAEQKLDELQPRNANERKGFQELKAHIRKLRDVLRTNKENLDKEKQRAEDLEKQLQGKPKEEDLQRYQKLEEWYNKTAVEEIANVNYGPKLQTLKDEALAMLKEAGVGEKILDVIEKRGGIFEFSQSNRPAGGEWKREDGKPMTYADYFNRFARSKLDAKGQRQFDRLIDRRDEIVREKNQTISKGKESAKEYVANVRKQAFEAFTNEAKATVEKLIKDLPKEVPRYTEKIPEDATPEEKARLEKWNKRWKYADENFPKILSQVDAATEATTKFKSLWVDALMEEWTEEKKRAEDLAEKLRAAEERIDKFKKAGSTARLRSAPPPARQQPQESDTSLTDEQALDRAFGR